MRGQLLTVEFRKKVSFDDAQRVGTLEFQRVLGVVHTIADAPTSTQNSVPAVWEVTKPAVALVRLHGRNHGPWNIKGAKSASDRFNYDYNDGELQELVPKVWQIEKKSPPCRLSSISTTKTRAA